MVASTIQLRVAMLCAAMPLAALLPHPGKAQHAPHTHHAGMPAQQPPASPASSEPEATAPESAKDAVRVPPVDHAAMGHGTPAPVDHAAMGHGTPASVDHAAMGHGTPPPSEPRTPIPVITDADRAAAVPPTGGHGMHDNRPRSFVLLDRFETWNAPHGTGLAWDGQGWFGTDLHRLWVRGEGERVDGATEHASIEALYGRSIGPWWDVVAGLRHDFGGGPSRDAAAIGVMGLSPYKFEIEATAYIDGSGRTEARLEAEYDTLITNRLILQSSVEASVFGEDDVQRGIGSGLGTAEVGLRLRYEFTRRFAPYVGVVHERAFGRTADLRRGAGDGADDTRVVAGVRIWF
ncbi:copper resistance protein B [Montanilutibacter psychrotolerans]|uniref:Copper resistance protein B n=1 Tax=Montanilutibacter psychrotolerans TaxID=1327343 RepID=A0A3M8T0K3_9GAMM|nr:copper resistance protein B [Lysobacter psychrotolerans]RNF86553.1 copper resistance protein B [Lysobacter psychrotolerans]